MRILSITNQVPYPPMAGAPLRTYHILRRFAKEHEVYLAALDNVEQERDTASPLADFCRAVVTVKRTRPGRATYVPKVVKALLQGGPLELRFTFSEELAAEIRRLADRVEFDVVQIEHGSMGMYLDVLPAPLRKRAVWVLHDIDYVKFMRIAQIEAWGTRKIRAWLHATMMRRWMPDCASRFGMCVTLTEVDRDLLLAANSRLDVEVSPSGIDTDQHVPLPEAGETANLLFVGNMAYEPNIDAATFFCRQVLPLIRSKAPAARLWIVGMNPPKAVKQLEGEGVVVTGAVADLEPHYARARVCVVPLRAGSGIHLKVLEGMALGRPVVATSLACEGLGVIPGEHLLMADDPKLFAEATLELLTNDRLRTRIVQKGREFVTASYDWNAIAENLMGNFERLVKQEQQVASIG